MNQAYSILCEILCSNMQITGNLGFQKNIAPEAPLWPAEG